MTKKLVFTLLAFLSLNAFSQKNASDLEKEANTYFEAENFVDAFPLFSQLVALDPGSAVYNYKFGTCALYAGERKETALKHLGLATKKSGAPPEAWYMLGKARHLNYEFKDAIKAYKKFNGVASADLKNKYNVALDIAACQNGSKLLTNLTEIVVLEKTTGSADDFFRYYNLENLDGRLLVTPEELRTKLDKKKDFKSVFHFRGGTAEIFFASYGETGENGKDIYKARMQPDGKWSKPELLGGKINTPNDEDYPFLHSDGSTFYFASTGHNSMGGYDIFKSDHVGGSFSDPVNLDFAINTPDDDILYIADSLNNEAYFASARTSARGQLSVYKVKVQGIPLNLVFLKGKFKSEVNPDDKVIAIKVRESETDRKIADITSMPENGEYIISLPKSGTYKFEMQIEGKPVIHEAIVTVPDFGQSVVLEQDMKLVKYDLNEKMVVNNLFDKAMDIDLASVSAAYLRQKAGLDVNASDELLEQLEAANTPSTEEVTVENVLVKAGFGPEVKIEAQQKILVQETAQTDSLLQRNKILRDQALALAFEKESALAASLQETKNLATAVGNPDDPDYETMAKAFGESYARTKALDLELAATKAVVVALENEQAAGTQKLQELQRDQIILSEALANNILAPALPVFKAQRERELDNRSEDGLVELTNELQAEAKDQEAKSTKTAQMVEDAQADLTSLFSKLKNVDERLAKAKKKKEIAALTAEKKNVEFELADLEIDAERLSEKFEKQSAAGSNLAIQKVFLDQLQEGKNVMVNNLEPIQVEKVSEMSSANIVQNTEELHTQLENLTTNETETLGYIKRKGLAATSLPLALLGPGFSSANLSAALRGVPTTVNNSEVVETVGGIQILDNSGEDTANSTTGAENTDEIENGNSTENSDTGTTNAGDETATIAENSDAGANGSNSEAGTNSENTIGSNADEGTTTAGSADGAVAESTVDSSEKTTEGEGSGSAATQENGQTDSSDNTSNPTAENTNGESESNGSPDGSDTAENQTGVVQPGNEENTANPKNTDTSEDTSTSEGSGEKNDTAKEIDPAVDMSVLENIESNETYIKYDWLAEDIEFEDKEASERAIKKYVPAFEAPEKIETSKENFIVDLITVEGSFSDARQQVLRKLESKQTELEGLDNLSKGMAMIEIRELYEALAKVNETDFNAETFNSAYSKIQEDIARSGGTPESHKAEYVELAQSYDIILAEKSENAKLALSLDGIPNKNAIKQYYGEIETKRLEIARMLANPDAEMIAVETEILGSEALAQTNTNNSDTNANDTAQNVPENTIAGAQTNDNSTAQNDSSSTSSEDTNSADNEEGVIDSADSESGNNAGNSSSTDNASSDVSTTENNDNGDVAENNESTGSNETVPNNNSDSGEESTGDASTNVSDNDTSENTGNANTGEESAENPSTLPNSGGRQDVENFLNEANQGTPAVPAFESKFSPALDVDYVDEFVPKVVEQDPRESDIYYEVLPTGAKNNSGKSNETTLDKLEQKIFSLEGKKNVNKPSKNAKIDKKIAKVEAKMAEAKNEQAKNEGQAMAKTNEQAAKKSRVLINDNEVVLADFGATKDALTAATENAESKIAEAQSLRSEAASDEDPVAANVKYEQALQLEIQAVEQQRRIATVFDNLEGFAQLKPEEQEMLLNGSAGSLRSEMVAEQQGRSAQEEALANAETFEAIPTSEAEMEALLKETYNLSDDEIESVLLSEAVVSYTAKQKETASLRKSVQDMDLEITRLKAEVVTFEAQIEEKQAEIALASGDEKATLQAEVQTLQTEVDEMGSAIDTKKAEKQEAQAELETAEVEVRRMAAEVFTQEKLAELSGAPVAEENTNVTSTGADVGLPADVVFTDEMASKSELIQYEFQPPTVVSKNVFGQVAKSPYSSSKPIPVDVALPSGVVFKVQVGAFRKPIPNDLFGGYTPVTGEKLANGITRYQVGYFTTFGNADVAKGVVRGNGFNDAFVVAFSDGQRISISDAMRKIIGAKGGIASGSEENGGNTAAGNNNAGANDRPVVVNTGNENATGATTGNNPRPNTDNLNAAETEAFFASEGIPSINTATGVFYSVQVGVYSKPKTSSDIFNVIPLMVEQLSNGTYRYISGQFNNLAAANARKEQIRRAGVSDAFVRAFVDGKSVSMAQARIALDGGKAFATPIKVGAQTNNDASQSDNSSIDTEPETIEPSATTSSDGAENPPAGGGEGFEEFNRFGDSAVGEGGFSDSENETYSVYIGTYQDDVPSSVALAILTLETKFGVFQERQSDGTTSYYTKDVTEPARAKEIQQEFSELGVRNTKIMAIKEGKRSEYAAVQD